MSGQVDPTFPVGHRVCCDLCGAAPGLEAERARLELENTELRQRLRSVEHMHTQARMECSAEYDRRTKALRERDEVMVTLRSYVAGEPNRRAADLMMTDVALQIVMGQPVHDVIKGLCLAASVPLPRTPLTRERAADLAWKFREAATGECIPRSSPLRSSGEIFWVVEAIIEASK